MHRPKAIHGKVIIAGMANAGKTCLIERFVRNVFLGDDPAHGPTVGCECLQKSLWVDDQEVYLYLYDTAGQERFADMAGSYYRAGDVCLLAFDLSDAKSLEHVKWWQRKVLEYNERCTFVLVGCKEDLTRCQANQDCYLLAEEEADNSGSNAQGSNSSSSSSSANHKNNRNLSQNNKSAYASYKPNTQKTLDMIQRWADSNGVSFFITSAKKGGPQISFLFHTVAEKCIRQAKERQIRRMTAEAEEKKRNEGENINLLQSAFGPADDARQNCYASCARNI